MRLGPFRLIEPMARGGMGEIWRGEHSLSRTMVAVKLLTEQSALSPAWRTTFRNEARAVASLDHPNIVQVFDYGEVDGSTAARSAGRLEEGTPWMAMEMVVGGTLTPLCGYVSWSSARKILEDILQALAHAHAREVLHRDIKPGNILLSGKVGRRGGLFPKLTDFGLAHSLKGDLPVAGAVAVDGGTPAYMAPEQFEGRWRDYGPWTDLYALGGLAWFLVTGAPPYGRGQDYDTRRTLALRGDLPPLLSPIPVPAGFEDWVRGLLRPDPAERSQRAADALWALRQLVDPEQSHLVPAGEGSAVGEMTTLLRPVQVETTLVLQPPLSPSNSSPVVHQGAQSLPPVDQDWRVRQEREARVEQLAFAGLGLFGVRPIELVGRVAERDLLWGRFVRTARGAGAGAVTLIGPTGSGKSRLAEWICQLAHERGAATVLKAVHRAQPGGGQGLVDMVARFLHIRGLSQAEVGARVRAFFRGHGLDIPDDIEVFVRWLCGVEEERAPTRTHFAILKRFLERVSRARPLILWLDDTHWGLEALDFATALMGSEAPIFTVLTVSPEHLAGRRLEEGAYAALRGEGSLEVPIGALPVEDRPELVRQLLDLEPDLARRVEARTAGNPLFAVQLVGDWVRRGQLVPGEHGFKLRLGVELRLPQTLMEVWREQLERALADRSVADAVSLELAATLGQEVNLAEWQQVVARAGLNPSPRLLGELEGLQLLRVGRERTPAVFRFVHPMLWEVAEARAKDGGRLQGHHQLCVQVLQEERGGEVVERLGRHLMGAGRVAEAVGPLLAGVDRAISQGQYSRAEEILAQREDALIQVEVPVDDPRWGEGWLRGYAISRWRGRFREARSRLERVEREARRYGWAPLLVKALGARGELERIAGELERAIGTLDQAERLAGELGDVELLAGILLEKGGAYTEGGRLKQAEEALTRSLRLQERLSARRGVAQCWMALGEVARNAGDHPRAAGLLEWSRDLFAAVGSVWEQAAAVNSLGDLRRIEGRLDEAVDLYREAARLFRRVGSSSAVYPEFNQGLTLLEIGRFAEARQVFRRTLPVFEGQGVRGSMAMAFLGLAACAGEDEADYRSKLSRGLELHTQTGGADEESARLVTLAAEAGERHSPGWALRAYLAAAEDWRAIGRTDEVEEIEARVAALQ